MNICGPEYLNNNRLPRQACPRWILLLTGKGLMFTQAELARLSMGKVGHMKRGLLHNICTWKVYA